MLIRCLSRTRTLPSDAVSGKGVEEIDGEVRWEDSVLD